MSWCCGEVTELGAGRGQQGDSNRGVSVLSEVVEADDGMPKKDVVEWIKVDMVIV